MSKKNMEQNKNEILLEKVNKIEKVLKALKENFDFENNFSGEYSSLSIVRDNFKDLFGK